jgi:hypothetical protein
VGSTDYGSIPLGATNCHGFASTPTLNTIPLYGPQPYGCARGYPYSQSQVNLTTKNLPALDWGPGAYDSEPPMEGYGIPTLHGLQNSDSYPVGYVATDGRPWHNTSQRQSINVTDYADQEPATTYAVQSAIVQTMPRHVLALSPDQGVLNTHTLSVHTQMPTQTGRVLPVPNPRPPQQALPSNLQEISTKASALSLNSGTPPNGLPPANPKTSMIWPPSHMGIEGRNNPIPNVTPDLMAPPPSKVSGASTVASDGSLVAYTTVNHSPGSSPPSLGHASTSVQQFPLSRTRNFTTSGLSSGGPMNESYTQESPLYTYSSDNSHKRNHLGDASGPHDALVSGRRYEPLGHHHQSESTSKMTLARRPSLEDRTSPNQHNMTTSTSKQAF